MYFCPKCYKKVVVDKSNHIYKGNNITVEIENGCTSVICDDCNQEYMIECDDKIIDCIIDLNKAGYTTCYCCQGHVDYRMIFKYSGNDITTTKEKFVTSPYIMFDKEVLKNKTFLKALNECNTIYIDFNQDSNITIYPINIKDDISEPDMTEEYMDICFNNLMNFVNLLLK